MGKNLVLDGLKPGDKVVTESAGGLIEGAKAAIKK